MAQPNQKKDNRGGKREGAGRKPETLSVNQVRLMLKKAKDWAKKTGKEVDDILLEIIYESKGDSTKLNAIKLWKEYTIAKLQEGGETDQVLGPQIGLPPTKPDPALSLVEDKKAG